MEDYEEEKYLLKQQGVEKMMFKIKNLATELHRAHPSEWNLFLEISLAGAVSWSNIIILSYVASYWVMEDDIEDRWVDKIINIWNISWSGWWPISINHSLNIGDDSMLLFLLFFQNHFEASLILLIDQFGGTACTFFEHYLRNEKWFSSLLKVWMSQCFSCCDT